MRPTKKPCSKCNKGGCEVGYRFCSTCRTLIEKEMSKSNYLTHVPLNDRYRGPGAREVINETRRGGK